MSNSHQPKYKRDLFTDFLMEHGYVGKMSIDSENICLTKDESKVKIPYEETLSKIQIEESLKRTDLSLSDFEEYIEHLSAMKMFTHYIDKSKK